MEAARIRAQIAQLEQYRTAFYTFQGKYNNYPGDIPASLVTTLGFTAAPTRGGDRGNGDGNGIIESGSGGVTYGYDQTYENLYFWEDLSTNSGLIPETLNTATNSSFNISASDVQKYFPKAKIGDNAYIITYSCYYAGSVAYTSVCEHNSYMQIMGIYGTVNNGRPRNRLVLTPSQAYNIDSKTDDGIAKTGMVLAIGANPTDTGSGDGLTDINTYSNAASSSSTTCFSTGTNSNGIYSTDVNSGANVTCGLSFVLY